jgi:hypothetical protein
LKDDAFIETKLNKIEKPWKTFNFDEISDNFYLNILDIYDSSHVAIGTRTGVAIYDPSCLEKNEKYSFENSSEIFCVKLM